MSLLKKYFPILSWAFYDLANQFFVLNISSLYFVRWITVERKIPEIVYSLFFGFSVFLVAVSSPFLGAISDMRKRYKSFLVFFTLLAIISTAFLGMFKRPFLSLVFFAIANFGTQEAIVFYNSLLIHIAHPSRIGLISGVGRVFGYSGALVALHFTKPIYAHYGYQAVFLFTSIMFFVFSLPCMIFVKEKVSSVEFSSEKEKIKKIFEKLKITLQEVPRQKDLLNFLKGIFLGLCVINTIILFMSVYVVKVFGLSNKEVVNFLIFSTFFAILGSFFSGFISDYSGYKNSLVSIFFIWIVVLLCAIFSTSTFLIKFIGILGGMVLGASWTVARALVTKIMPSDKIGEAFGLFNLAGYLSAIVGPLFWSMVLFLFSFLDNLAYRIAFFSLIPFMVLGIIFILRLPQSE